MIATAAFQPFSAEHAAALAWTVPPMAAACVLGRRWLWRHARGLDPRGRVKEGRLALGWGVFAAVVNAASIGYWLMPERFSVQESLPLQLCDLACLNAVLVFLTGWRLPRALMFFWGLGLSTQAFVTPTLTVGPETARYWLFWLVHVVIVGSASYDVAARGYRPGAGDLGRALVVTVVWTAGVFVLNLMIGSNYGYVGRGEPGAPTIVDALGPWPLRVVWMSVAGTVVFVGLWAGSRLLPRAAGEWTPHSEHSGTQ